MTLPPDQSPAEDDNWLNNEFIRPSENLSPLPEERLQIPAEAPYLPSPRLRSRRKKRSVLVRPDYGDRAEFMENMARRAYPTYEFFIFSALAGAAMGLGYLADAQALLVFAALLTPLLSPWVGIALSTVTGAARYFFQSLFGFLIGGFIIFVTAVMAGLGARIFMPLSFNQAFYHTRLWWPDLVLLAIGAIILVVSFARNEDKPLLPSVMLAYELYLPLSAAGFGLGVGLPGLWPDGLLVFGIHLALAVLFGIITFLLLGFRPLTFAGYTLGTSVTIIVFVSLVTISGFGTAFSAKLAMPGPVPTLIGIPASETETPLSPTVTTALTSTPTQKPTNTPTIASLPPTETATPTLPPEPTPVYARILAIQGDGVIIRHEPAGAAKTSLLNGILVQVLPEVREVNGSVWVRIIALTGEGNIEGWVLQSVLSMATPVPNWQPSSTPAP